MASARIFAVANPSDPLKAGSVRSQGIVRAHGQTFSDGFIRFFSSHGKDGDRSPVFLFEPNRLFDRIAVPFVEIKDQPALVDIFPGFVDGDVCF